MYKRFVKRLLDFLFATLLFAIILPFFLVISLLVFICLGKPVFFKQERSGLHEKTFKIIKFRTMTNEKDSYDNYLSDKERITRLGKFLRSTSLDELPELLNIILGEMSIIGPRPLPPEYHQYYTENEKKRFEVRGGLIPPEVLYKNVQPTWDQQFTFETLYVDQLSFLQDVKIFFSVMVGLFIRYENSYGEYVRPSLIECRQYRSEKEN